MQDGGGLFTVSCIYQQPQCELHLTRALFCWRPYVASIALALPSGPENTYIMAATKFVFGKTITF